MDDGEGALPTLSALIIKAKSGLLTDAAISNFRKGALVDVIRRLLAHKDVLAAAVGAFPVASSSAAGEEDDGEEFQDTSGDAPTAPNVTNSGEETKSSPLDAALAADRTLRVQGVRICKAFWRGSRCTLSACQRRHPPVCQDERCLPRRQQDCEKFHLVERKAPANNRGNRSQGNGKWGRRPPPPSLADILSRAYADACRNSGERSNRKKKERSYRNDLMERTQQQCWSPPASHAWPPLPSAPPPQPPQAPWVLPPPQPLQQVQVRPMQAPSAGPSAPAPHDSPSLKEIVLTLTNLVQRLA